MIRRCYTLMVLALAVVQLTAQDGIITHNDFTTQTLVKDIFASGACDNIDLIVPIGNTDGIGYFENGSAAIGLDKGIILATGPTWHAQGPNNSTEISGDLSGPNGDNDLNRLSEGNVFDAAGIAFDFVPLDSFVSFRYVFASEEYCEFVGSDYNDVFGFFVSGPGIDGEFSANANNVAIIPGTDDFVAINSVNYNQNSDYYVPNERPEDRDICNLESVPTPHLNQIQYDGFTTVLTAVLKVQPCETYHIRLVVGDVSDPFFDSAVFLEAGSFNLGGEIAVSTVGDSAGDTQLFEGCEDAAFRFSRSAESPLDLPLTVNYYISSASTATAGTDYTTLPAIVTIPAGDSYIDVPVSSLPDTEEEEEELIRVVLDIPCACYADSADLYIVPPIPLSLVVDDVYVCPDTEATMSVEIGGGIAPYSFNWSGGSQEDSQEVNLNNAVQQLTVTDACGQSAMTEANVLAINPPSALLSGIDTICQGDTAWLNLALEAVFPVALTYQLNNNTTAEVILTENTGFPATAEGNYELLAIEDAACAGNASGNAALTVWELSLTADITDVKCADGADGQISLHEPIGDGPFEYQWSPQESNATIQEGLMSGTYSTSVTDIHQCQSVFTWEVEAPLGIEQPQLDCDDLFAGEITLNTNGGTPPYAYQIDGSEWYTHDDWLEGLYPGDVYNLSIIDANECQLDLEWIMPVVYEDGMAALSDQLEWPLGITAEVPIQYYLTPNLIDEISWNSTQLNCNDCLYPTFYAVSPEQLTLEITDIFGCQQLLSTQVEVIDRVDVFIPNAFSPNGDENNDLWNIFGNPLQIARIEQLLIFDRWGNHLFQADDWPINSSRHGWDGTYRGKHMDVGVYAYSITFRLVNGEYRTVGGDVLLMR